MKELINKHIQEHNDVLDSISQLDESIEKVANIFISCLENDGTIFWCGNGGSASDSQHLACLLYTSPSPRDAHESRMPSSA